MSSTVSRPRRIDLAKLRTALWTVRAARRANATLKKGGLDTLEMPEVPDVPASAGSGVVAVLKRRNDSCLVRAAVRQAWWRAQGEERVLVIGVTKPSGDFSAHAWLEGDPPCHSEGFKELLRLDAR